MLRLCCVHAGDDEQQRLPDRTHAQLGRLGLGEPAELVLPPLDVRLEQRGERERACDLALELLVLEEGGSHVVSLLLHKRGQLQLAHKLLERLRAEDHREELRDRGGGCKREGGRRGRCTLSGVVRAKPRLATRRRPSRGPSRARSHRARGEEQRGNTQRTAGHTVAESTKLASLSASLPFASYLARSSSEERT